MKKIVGQLLGFKGQNDQPNIGGVGTGTLRDYRILYEVPAPTNPDGYSDTIYADVTIYVFCNSTQGDNNVKSNFNIRILENGNSLQNPGLVPNGSAVTTDESVEEKGKNLLINNPKYKVQQYPIKLDNIYLRTGDRICVQILDEGITVQAFAEELQYDTDAKFKMERDQLGIINQTIEDRLSELNQTQQDRLSDIDYTLSIIAGCNSCP